MPPKRDKKEKAKKSDDPMAVIQNDLTILAENLCGNQSIAKTQLVLSRGDAAYYVWRHAIGSEAKRQDISRKHACIPYLLQLVGSADIFSRHMGIGCLQFLAQSEDLRDMIITRGYGDKSLSNVIKILEGDHDRTKVRAAALLYQVCQVPEIAILMRDYLQPIISCLAPSPHKWAGSEDGRAFAAGILRSFSHCDFAPEVMNTLPDGSNLRATLLQHGVLQPLLSMISDGNQMAQTEAVCLLAVLCEEDGVALEILESGGLTQLIQLVGQGQEEARAHAAGVLKLMAVEPEFMEAVALAGAIPPLVRLLTPNVEGGGGGGKKGTATSKVKTKKKKGGALPPALDLAIQNAAGALHHLSFLESTIRIMVDSNCIHALVGLLESRNVETFKHATGVLYNIALDPDNYTELCVSKAPPYLTRPLHARCLIRRIEDRDQPEWGPQVDYDLSSLGSQFA